MDSFYDYIWDVTILEYLTRILEHITHVNAAGLLIECTSPAVISMFLNSAQTFTTSEEKLKKDKLL